jgi:hypothetical protein
MHGAELKQLQSERVVACRSELPSIRAQRHPESLETVVVETT